MAEHVWKKQELDQSNSMLVQTQECVICRGSGKTLTEDCCGKELTAEQKIKIIANELDYKGDKWRTYVKMY